MTTTTKRSPKPRGPKLVVNVTTEIIERSKQANSRSCMIAEAIKEAIPHALNVQVDLQTCRFTDPKRGLRFVYLTPRTGQKPLLQFDQGQTPEPFQLRLKNAHVLRPKRSETKSALAVGGKAKTRIESSGSITKVGGRAPPQMRTLRRFGIRAFQGFAGNELPERAALKQSEES